MGTDDGSWKNSSRIRLVHCLVLVLLLFACGAEVSFDDLPEIVVTARDLEFDGPDTAEGGMVRVTLRNEGSVSHQLELVRVAEGIGESDILEAIGRRDIAALNNMVTYHGGPNEVPPDSSRTVVTELEPGTYVLLCFVSTDGGTLHVLQGMVATMDVTAPVSEIEWTPPEPDATVSLRDFEFELSGDIGAGRQIVLVENHGSQPHEWRLITAGLPGGGSSTISPGRATWVELDSEPGRYAFICYVPSEAHGGRQHIDLGMRASIEVP